MWIEQRIDWHVYKPNQRAPSVRKLAEILGVSSFTVSNAKMEWAIRQVASQSSEFVYSYGSIEGFPPLIMS